MAPLTSISVIIYFSTLLFAPEATSEGVYFTELPGFCLYGGEDQDVDYDYIEGGQCNQNCIDDESCYAYYYTIDRPECGIFRTPIDGGDNNSNAICYIKHQKTGEANCCTSWSEACYTTPSHDNYGHPCNKTDGACEDVCVSNEDSAECQKCCISVTHDSTHGTTWDCVDRCDPNPCGTNAVCEDGTCSCPPGTTGDPSIACDEVEDEEPTDTETVPKPKPDPVPCKNRWGRRKCNRKMKRSNRGCSNPWIAFNCLASCKVCCANIMKGNKCQKRVWSCNQKSKFGKKTRRNCRKSCGKCGTK